MRADIPPRYTYHPLHQPTSRLPIRAGAARKGRSPRDGRTRRCRNGSTIQIVTTTAIQAQHAHNLLRLARVNAALSAWDEYESNRLLPPDLRRPLPRPKLTRGGLKELQLMLVQRIGELEELVGRG